MVIQSRARCETASFDFLGSTETNVVDGFTLAAVGDVMMRRPHTIVQAATLSPVAKILQDADVSFGNLETNLTDLRTSKGGPTVNGDAYHVATPAVAPDLKAVGFNMMARANNHAYDWGIEGMRETTEVLDQIGIVHAGSGENLAQAAAPHFLETRRGRIGLISLTMTFPSASRAADAAGQAPGRPGLSALRLTRIVVVAPDMLESLRRIRNGLPGPIEEGGNPNQVVVADTVYRAGNKIGYSFEPNAHDETTILRNIREGKQLSDFLIVSNHDHNPGNWSEVPSDYAQVFARKTIDVGADAHIAHGPHILRGIEIYKGRPIFYSLGNFLFDNLNPVEGADYFEYYGLDPRKDTVPDVIAAAMKGDFANPVYYESVVAVSRFEQNQLVELRLFPIELNFTKRLADRGVPRLAPPAHGQAILERLQRLSEPYGTHIAIESGVGVIRLRSAATSVETSVKPTVGTR
ncbi:CapA family protein [Bradyrhizobium sp. 157]|uniref:CapA family protein n=1 Tax=Bradyrhizobium sp. 157 TaxID=2782631 RepID=UPI001FF8E57B|nr:CapA family protein [Bradyrhizobium sp. 157]